MPGRHSEVTTINDSAGGVYLAWSTHIAGQWRIHTVHWSEQILVGTANGLFMRVGAGPWATIGGLPSNDVRAIALDANNTAWIATATGAVLRHADGTIVALTPALLSSDVRNVTLGHDGTAWFATASGVDARAPDGTITTITTANGLPSNDVRAVVVSDDGALWVATAAGVMERLSNGVVHVLDASSGLPSNSSRDVAVAHDGTVYVATAAGLAVRAPNGSYTIFDVTNGLGSSDVRAVRLGNDGTVWVATAHGVSRHSTEGTWTTFDTGHGLASNDVRTVSLAADGTTWLGTAAGVSVITVDGTVSNLDLLGGGATNPAAQSIHTGWSAPRALASGGGGNREPILAVDETNRIWLIWSQRVGSGNPDESWGLHYRIFDPPTRSWGADTTLTAPAVGGRSSDRMPGALRITGGMRVFFSSDRQGGFGLWSVDVTLTGAVAPLISLFDAASSELAPAPITIGSAVWLLYRSDRNVPLAQVGSSPLGDGLLRSVRVPDNGTVRRYAGSVTMTLDDLARMRTRRLFGDMLSYTPNRPDGEAPLADDELYTRGTIGLYVSRANKGSPLTRQEVARLRELLARFIPVNLRALVLVLAAADTEFVYRQGADIQESYHDEYPFADALGALSDAAAAAMPALVLFRSNLIDNISADPADLTTLRRRTFFPPLQ
jgi:hypothetical protein